MSLRADGGADTQQFRVTFVNTLVDCDLSLDLRIDGELVQKSYLRAGQYGRILGIYKAPNAVLPFKFQELELVGACPRPARGLFGR